MSLTIANALRSLRRRGLVGALKRWTYVAVRIPLTIRKIKRIPASEDLQSLLDFCVADGNDVERVKGLVVSIQVRQEIERFLTIVKDLRPRRVLEIGTAGGGTLFLLCRCADPEAKVISLDLPGGTGGHGYAFYRIPLYQSFALPTQELHLVRDNSHEPGSLEHVKSLLGGEPLDLLLIDGDHSYEGAKQDFEMYSPLVRPGGVLAFHDIVPNPSHPEIQVPRFWEEVKGNYQHEEIVKDRARGLGIGVLWM